jgi:hypothetical protein
MIVSSNGSVTNAYPQYPSAPPHEPRISIVRREICVSDQRANVVLTMMALSEVTVMKIRNIPADIPIFCIPQIDMNGTTNEYAMPSAKVANSSPPKLGCRKIFPERVRKRRIGVSETRERSMKAPGPKSRAFSAAFHVSSRRAS